MNTLITKSLKQVKDYTALKRIRQVYGGSINESFYVETKQANYFIKCHTNAPNRLFEMEVKGLQLIRATNTISVPEVLTYSDVNGESFLVMEWIEGYSTEDTETKLGYQIASMHQFLGEQHGFMYDTFIGLLPQPNGLYSDWLTYYRDQRLLTQLYYGIEQNRITNKRRTQLEQLLTRLYRWIPKDVEPSYLHGDLWGGNWLVGRKGKPFVIDPSFFYGDRHLELAFTELFNGFSEAFYQAYISRFPLSSNYEDMKPIYQLYYLLVHLNVFGESYGSRVDAILNHYVGK